MKNQENKNTFILFLLIYLSFNCLVAPFLWLYSWLYNAEIFTINNWTYSFVLNLGLLQLYSYGLKEGSVLDRKSSLTEEFQKFAVIRFLHQQILWLMNKFRLQKVFIGFLSWYAILACFIIPTIYGLLTVGNDVILNIGMILVSFQLVSFGLYYHNKYLVKESDDNMKSRNTPWFTEIFFKTSDN